MLEYIQAFQARGTNSSEDSIISDCPDTPAHNDQDFHKEILIDLIPEALKSLERIKGTNNCQANKTPTSLCKVTTKKDVQWFPQYWGGIGHS